jgi:hypothetical protein
MMRKFDRDSNTRTRVFGKRDFQRVLKELKQQGASVEKNDLGGYDVLFGEDMILQAVNGTNSYLVRIDSDALTEA